ncbi:hypothetical protein SAMN05444277_101124 [Parafilimonas terrae]|uniref:Uncharacterized protein n=1 Tax=Parafilimonas terrae TaxID=1465490 RepID=A0A1I5R827_9BACT|nr:hypothetical protein SAMN05444277_101124 [Parafilimonas terrae]
MSFSDFKVNIYVIHLFLKVLTTISDIFKLVNLIVVSDDFMNVWYW